MSRSTVIPRGTGVLFAWVLGLSGISALAQDPGKVMSAEACGECHVAELEVWKKTPHATGFKTLHRMASAEAIRDRMGLRLIKRDSVCLKCHYTPALQSGQLRAASGVSCESCHGAGADWINVHNDYGGKGVNHASETPEHRARRVEESRRAGMRRPSDLYPVVTNCYGCHTVPEEKLVNVGGHSIGSGDFELVAWSQGKIRHNFLQSFLTGDGTENAERGAERKRLMYVVGRAVALEYGLRGTAAATGQGIYLKAMQRRVRGALSEVRAIARRAELPEVDAMVAAVRSVKVGLGNPDALLTAADAVGTAAREFLDRHPLADGGGATLASLDPLVLGIPDDVDDEDETAVADVGETPAADDVPPSGGTAAASTTPAQAAATPAGTAAPASAGGTGTGAQTTGAIPAVGEKKTRVRPASRFKTLGPNACNKCHTDQNQWWFDDAHFRAVEPFFDQAPDNVRIARLYGVKPSQMTRGNSLCMDCHGAVISGREKRTVQDGVGCESCHGPAAEYKEPHQEGDKALGTSRPGYGKALTLGMTELQDAEVRARTCTGCHYVTDQRLISAGHPSGKAFDYLAAMNKINHWQDDPAAAALKAAFAKALAERGSVPEVQLAQLGIVAPPSSGPAPTARDRAATPAELSRRLTPRPSGPAASAGPPAGLTAAGSGARPEVPAVDETPVRGLDLPPFPEIDGSTSVEEVLLLLKKRFELLYRKVYQEPGGRP